MKLKALVVDDSRIMRNMVMETLRKTGLAEFEFVEAADGGDAIGKFDPDVIDIAFVDWNMPNLDGIEFARHARSMRRIKAVPVIMVTSESAASKKQAAFDEARITHYITKPFTVEMVKGIVGPILREMGEKNQSASQPAAKPTGGFFSKLVKGD